MALTILNRKPNCPSPAVGRDPVEMWKGHLCGFQGETKGLDEFTTKSLLPGSSTASVTRFTADGIPVVTSPMVYIGTLFSFSTALYKSNIFIVLKTKKHSTILLVFYVSSSAVKRFLDILC
jgi:hypothetical protein